MNRIDLKFKELKKNNKKAFIAFIMAGDPSIDITEKLIFELETSGADIIELGVPFSDPLADGPTIQRSSQRALKNKVNLDSVFNLVKRIRSRTQVPVVFLTYYNLIYYYGLERFARMAKASGVDGAVIPDLPFEESGPLRDVARKNGVAIAHLAAPTSSKERLKKIAEASTGFIYYVSLTGTTGAREILPQEIFENLRLIKKMTRKPVCVGFGISSAEQVARISMAADGVIVGSAIVKVIEKNIGKKDLVKKVGGFVKTLVKSKIRSTKSETNSKHKI
ncbi:MAG: tryptophan synthase subunit alpha [Candidatus Omnitrophica bacterium]|nr:tryptophan synthase subunit alpha [Candidatus Omnitrophota bacterium]MBU4148878.1 tryptophan synthase subunit alpha [Candidatus Omnitrophota bacterium]